MKSTRKFSWNGPVPPKGDVQKIGAELDKLHARDGTVLASAVVEAARPQTSPLHNEFEWDDSEAANRFRLEQARKLIQCVSVQIVKGRQSTNTRAFVYLRTEARGFHDTVEVMDNERTRAMLLAEAMRELDSFQRKYAHLTELASVFQEAEKVRVQVKRSNVAQPNAAAVEAVG